MEKTFKGYTKIQILKSMLRLEKMIAYYNNKYNFDVENNGSINEIKEYNLALKCWDGYKQRYNTFE